MTPKYRPDIDGLRAVAVLSILFYHMGVARFSGGYVGVDIFFVISGYLITSIIVRELAAGEFSIARFYERRVRRILPALTVVVVATLLLGLVLLSPAQLEELGRSAAATSVFSSNIFFFLGSGYFEGSSELKPLLHTWSLAVEEQYYIFFPFLLMFIAKRHSARFGVWLISLGVVSLLACIIWTRSNAPAAFYLIPFRAWELLIGSVLALRLVPKPAGPGMRNALALLGASLMLTSVFVYTPETRFPGAAAALPTLGTAFIIHAGSGGKTFVNRALGIRPMVFVGLISYSLYLWHWPIVVFAKQYLINEWTDLESGVILLVILLLSTLSWRFVETPFRNRRLFGPRERLFTVFAAVSVVLIGTSLSVVLMKGFPGRDAATPLSEIIAADPGWQHWKNCEEAGEKDIPVPELCAIGAEQVPPSFMFWGDSHALAMASAINLSAQRNGVAGLLAVRTACPPLLSVDRRGETSCHEFNQSILAYLAARPDIETVILAARWAFSTSGTRYKNEPGDSVTLADLGVDASASTGNAAVFERGLRRTVTALSERGKNVVLVTQVPEVGHDVPSASYAARLTGRDVNAMIAPTTGEYRERNAEATRVFDALRTQSTVTVIDPSQLLCDEQHCRIVVDATPLYRDDHHLSLRGCVLISHLFDELLAHSAQSRNVTPR
ncbi:MAG: acyltransferase [Gammaproteobacteria bacterium]|nr:acyltransferase [Gammaproteobacteria bacterium]MDH3433485.1 acyltransferase [Gammaproteobacteria bacterium]